MAKIRIVDRPSKDGGELPLYLRISHAGTTRYLSTSLKVPPSYWDRKRGEVRKTYRHAALYNRRLQEIRTAAADAMAELQTAGIIYTADRIKERTEERLRPQPQDDGDFLAYAREVVARYGARGQVASEQRLRAIVDKLEDFWHRRAGRGKPLPFDRLTPALIEAWRTDLVGRHRLAHNTVAKSLKGLRTLTRTAIKEGRMPQEQYPFFHITIKERKRKKGKLTYEQIQAIEAVELEAGTWEAWARDAFVFSFYSFGARFGDVCQLTPSNVRGGRLEYRTQKNDIDISLRLAPAALAIAERHAERGGYWLFPMLEGRDPGEPDDVRAGLSSANVLVNRALKDVAAAAGVDEHVTFHVARHSFANHARKGGWSLSEISKALAHASLRQTETYLASLGDTELDSKVDDLF